MPPGNLIPTSVGLQPTPLLCGPTYSTSSDGCLPGTSRRGPQQPRAPGSVSKHSSSGCVSQGPGDQPGPLPPPLYPLIYPRVLSYSLNIPRVPPWNFAISLPPPWWSELHHLFSGSLQCPPDWSIYMYLSGLFKSIFLEEPEWSFYNANLIISPFASNPPELSIAFRIKARICNMTHRSLVV